MDIFSVILPFLMYGLMSAVFARFTGINMSMYLLMIFLYMGAKPGETIVAMLLFNTFTYFTVLGLAELLGKEPEELATATYDNAVRLFTRHAKD